MSKKRNKDKPKKQRGQIHAPEGLMALVSEAEFSSLKRRINKRRGACAICHNTLGRTKDLALTLAPNQVEDLETLTGSWHVTVTHRTCRKESVQDIDAMRPQHTYTTTLLALPVMGTEGLPQQVPALLINPSVDHFMLYKDKTGKVTDQTTKYLAEEVGFALMSDEARETPEAPGLRAYVNGANVTVAANDHGLSWTHEQPAGNAGANHHLAASLRNLLESWDNTLLVMVSTKFRANDPSTLLATMADLVRDGHVYTAPATVEYRESNADLVEKALAAATGLGADG